MLHQRYYKDYGLAIEGLARHHRIDPLVFNREVDDILPLDDILLPDLELRAFLEAFDRTKVKLWLFTNAHVTHGMRVVKLLDVGPSSFSSTPSGQPLICSMQRTALKGSHTVIIQSSRWYRNLDLQCLKKRNVRRKLPALTSAILLVRWKNSSTNPC